MVILLARCLGQLAQPYFPIKIILVVVRVLVRQVEKQTVLVSGLSCSLHTAAEGTEAWISDRAKFKFLSLLQNLSEEGWMFWYVNEFFYVEAIAMLLCIDLR